MQNQKKYTTSKQQKNETDLNMSFAQLHTKNRRRIRVVVPPNIYTYIYIEKSDFILNFSQKVK